MANPTFRPIVRAWNQILHKAHEHKNVQFQKDADQAMAFFDGPYDWLYSGSYGAKQGAFSLGAETIPRPTFRMTMNKAAEVVQLYGPSLYARNPHREISMRRQSEYPIDLIPDPQQQQMVMQSLQQKQRIKQIGAELLKELINYTPNELDLRLHSRRAVDEALITGMGVLWTEPFSPAGSDQTFVGSFHDTVDNLLIDPDMETIQDAKWIARRKIRPKWQVAKEFGIPVEDLRGGMESSNMQAAVTAGGPDYEYFRQQGETNDLLVYFEIYSRMGLGHRMHHQFNKHLEMAADVLDDFGEEVRIIITDDYDYPLNVPEKVLDKGNMDEIRDRLQWPTPFYKDATDPWPVSYLAFHERPRKIWPMGHLKPGLGELSFLNWAASFLADKVKNTSRDFIATLRSLDEDVKANLLGGSDLTLLEFEKVQGNNINDVIQFLQHPPFNKDILEVVQMMMKLFEERVGLNELMYGTSKRQLRSAAEANVKSESMRIRPDDMAECVEAWSTKQARKEVIASYWHYQQSDVLPILGEERAQLYGQTVMQMDLSEIIYEFDIRVEAGSIRKPNRDKDLTNINTAIQVWGPVVQQYASLTGDFEPLNFLAAQWEKVNEMEPRGIQFQPPPPPEPDETAIQEAQMDLEIKQQEHQMKMQQGQEAHQVKLQQQMEAAGLKGQMDASKHQQGQGQDEDKHAQKLTQEQEKHFQELTQDQQKFLLDMLQSKAEGSMDLALKQMLGKVKVASENAAPAQQPAASANGNGKAKPKPSPQQKKAMEDREIRKMIDELSKLYDMNREEVEAFTTEMLGG